MSHRTCSVESCEEKHSARGYCAVHYQHWYRWGDPLYYASPGKKDCSFPGCPGVHDSHGYCSAHAKQLRDGVELHPLRPFWHGASCTVADCDEPIIAQGFCLKHWRAWNKYGDPLYRAPHGPQIPWRRWNLNEAYFDNITTEEQAYWLGFIAADGSIIDDGNTCALRMELATLDEAHVQALADSLDSDTPVVKYRACVHAYFNSRKLVDALGHLGIGPRKSATVQPWCGPVDLMPHYWRGLFDGDGSIYELPSRPGEWGLSLIGSSACVDEFAVWAREISGSQANPRPAAGGMWTWAVQGGRKPQLLAEALYADATVGLTRKRATAAELATVDFGAISAAVNARRSIAMRDAWRTGRHPRSRNHAA